MAVVGILFAFVFGALGITSGESDYFIGAAIFLVSGFLSELAGGRR